jgi:hypothetical protein
MNFINGIYILLYIVIIVPMLLGVMFYVGKTTHNFFTTTNITFPQMLFGSMFVTIVYAICKHFLIA